MTRRSLIAIAAATVVAGVAWWVAGHPGIGSGGGDVAHAPLRRAEPEKAPARTVTIRGGVIDQATGAAVGKAVVVFRGDDGDTTATADPSGRFEAKVPRGHYRVFVRDDQFISIGLQGRPRLDGGPRPELAGVADDSLMPTLDASADLSDLDVCVTKAGIVTDTLRDEYQRPVAGVTIRAGVGIEESLRPVLGTDTAITNASGRFELRVPPGEYELEIRHPRYAGIVGETRLSVDAGVNDELALELRAGCIIDGKVVLADGMTPGPDGAIERDDPGRRSGFGPSGRVDPGGSFHWTTTETAEITLRAWPWRSPPSNARTFDCRDGRHYEDVVLAIEPDEPDLDGSIVDAQGRRVPFAYLDVTPLDPRLSGQQERADAGGRWHVYNMFPANYRFRASAPGRGVVTTNIMGPKHGVVLKLDGTGRIGGTTSDLARGSIEVTLLRCGPKDDPLAIAPEPRIVPVVGGRFTIEDVPACNLTFFARWRDKTFQQTVTVDPGRTAYVSLELGAGRDKTITGIVRDRDDKPVSGARVTAVIDQHEVSTARTDANGRYTITARAGSQLVAASGYHVGRATVGHADVANEIVDLVLSDVDQ